MYVLLAKAYAGLGRSEEAKAAREDAWRAYKQAPRFKRRQDRSWAWKAKPIAALVHYGAIVLAVALVVLVVPRLLPSREVDLSDAWAASEEEGWNVEAESVSSDRFLVEVTDPVREVSVTLARSDLNENGVVDLRRKLATGDLWCRVLVHYPNLAGVDPKEFITVTDRQSDSTFKVWLPWPTYYASDESARASIFAFEALLESEDPPDCELELTFSGGTGRHGLRDGRPFGFVTP